MRLTIRTNLHIPNPGCLKQKVGGFGHFRGNFEQVSPVTVMSRDAPPLHILLLKLVAMAGSIWLVKPGFSSFGRGCRFLESFLG